MTYVKTKNIRHIYSISSEDYIRSKYIYSIKIIDIHDNSSQNTVYYQIHDITQHFVSGKLTYGINTNISLVLHNMSKRGFVIKEVFDCNNRCICFCSNNDKEYEYHFWIEE